MARSCIRVTGTVQGVGFRPFVYRQAVELGLVGSVCNDGVGVLIDVEGDPHRIAELARRLVAEAPELAHVAAVTTTDVPAGGTRARQGFAIVESRDAGTRVVTVGADTATCTACLEEVDDPADRRYRYPFASCTNCGPRYTIVRTVPYDRATTTMATFAMCATCRTEYTDPDDRRFHAQPIACARCGPILSWRDPAGRVLGERADALDAAAAAIRAGRVVALKGIGGYHLVVDATSSDAVSELRRRKARDDKPFAVMVPDVATARSLCDLDDAALAALCSPRRPIVLVPTRARAGVAPEVAPGLPELGCLLPYSALHHLLCAAVKRPVVCTSGNQADEPIAHTDDDAVDRLGPLVDGFLSHDRPIHVRCDDSVARAHRGRVQLLRRSRGYVPEPVALPVRARSPILAVGAELKNTVTVAREEVAIASQHIGDLEHLGAWQSFEQAVAHLCALAGVMPELVAHDLHPEYLSSKFALDLGLPTLGVQHHHAHVASCMVEHGRVETVLGLAFDGLGYGDDGAIWGGELLVADLRTSRRVGHLRAMPMPGGAAAIREPWRMAAVWAQAAVGTDRAAELVATLDSRVDAVLDLVATGGAPRTTSMGRLFDGVAALVVGRRAVRYEAQAAIELEALARRVDRGVAPKFDGAVTIVRTPETAVLDPSDLVAEIVDAAAAGVAREVLAAGFHEAIGTAAGALAVELAAEHGLDTAVLTGGVFQNVRLTDIVEDHLRTAGLRVLLHGAIPPNDGGISIGQAAVAAASAG